jgi:hypothetical protein
MSQEKKLSSVESIVNEKALESPVHDAPLIDLKTAALNDQVGDVYDDVRAIDMGEDGKERPIGNMNTKL